ncbi:hypothetical protein TNIN_116441 [Trichonephila inaurata madagascariensis]|uniref:Uncharacterized protein n=1 Tax=Trichonephila inaurata madagascariensis TaxID=2747483 RepID=A0A8X7CHY9_9ARAC|nr:hypothetical protein TNIN_116441 [Trichonephila inaurata madagascariensis]
MIQGEVLQVESQEQTRIRDRDSAAIVLKFLFLENLSPCLFKKQLTKNVFRITSTMAKRTVRMTLLLGIWIEETYSIVSCKPR